MKNKLMKIILQIFLTITGIACIPTLIVNAADSMERTYQPAGLCNLGNTCYMNATLQALLNDKELVGYTLTAPESDINKVNRLGSGGRVFAAFKALCQQYVSSNGIAVKPDEFKRIFGNFYALFDDYNQHDASECLISVLDALHEDLNQSDVAKGFMTRKHANDTLGGMPLHYACNKSPIVDIYHGVQHTDFTCPDCHHTSSKDEALINWDLNISSTSTTNLNDCIDLYSRSEILAPGEEWNCENCGRLVRATKTVSIKKLASRITIQLKRFSQTPTGGLVKNPAPVIYPVEFDASKYAVNAGSYELNSIICHFGTLNGGHYISYVKNNGQWFRCDDSSVTLVSEKEALSQTSAAYVLLYSKKPIDFQTTDIPLNTTTPLATDVPPAKPFLITQPVVVKPVSTVQQRPVAKPSFSLSSGIPDEETLEVFRVYNPNNGMHHYTMNQGEVDSLLTLGWRDEGVAFKCSANGVPVYRLYNPNDGTHHYTMDENEKNHLANQGWNDEGIAWYAKIEGDVPVFRIYNPGNGEHVWTTNYAEVENAVAHGWRNEGIAWYIQ